MNSASRGLPASELKKFLWIEKALLQRRGAKNLANPHRDNFSQRLWIFFLFIKEKTRLFAICWQGRFVMAVFALSLSISTRSRSLLAVFSICSVAYELELHLHRYILAFWYAFHMRHLFIIKFSVTFVNGFLYCYRLVSKFNSEKLL